MNYYIQVVFAVIHRLVIRACLPPARAIRLDKEPRLPVGCLTWRLISL
jgi:hypothetical protein